MRKNAAIIAWLAAGVLIALALWTSLSSLNWAVIIKWLPRLSQGALLTLELVAIAVVATILTILFVPALYAAWFRVERASVPNPPMPSAAATPA